MLGGQHQIRGVEKTIHRMGKAKSLCRGLGEFLFQCHPASDIVLGIITVEVNGFRSAAQESGQRESTIGAEDLQIWSL